MAAPHRAQSRGGSALRAFQLETALEQFDAEAIRIARQLRHSRRRVIGLMPASGDAVLWPLALSLGAALERICTDRIALVDAELRWPEIESASAPEAPPFEHAFMSIQPLTTGMVLVAPYLPPPEGAKVQLLSVMLAEIDAQSPPFAHVILDLTGFHERTGEFLAVIEAVDGILVVARAAATHERELVALDAELPELKNLGVLLLH